MSNITDELNSDLKQAMIKGDKRLVSTLRGLKSSLQYAAVEAGAGATLSEQDEITVLQKESKKRSDAIELYKKAGESERSSNEEYEKTVIDNYLPDLLSEDKVSELVEEAIKEQGGVTQQNMGKVIAAVRQKSDGLAEGSLIARLVKERLAL